MKIKKITPKPQTKTVAEEDYDFDFTIYERAEKQSEQLQSIKDTKKPRITGLRSKFNISTEELQSLLILKNEISKYGIKVAARTTDINDLWSLYGCLDEYWARIHDIYGTLIITEIQKLNKNCLILIKRASNTNQITDQTYYHLLQYRKITYRVAQRIGLGLEVEKTNFGHFDKAKKGIIE